jgi:hypothetical protein
MLLEANLQCVYLSSALYNRENLRDSWHETKEMLTDNNFPPSKPLGGLLLSALGQASDCYFEPDESSPPPTMLVISDLF